jgi:two-component system LytT family response regulator
VRLAQALEKVRGEMAARDAEAHRDRLLKLLAHVSGRPELSLEEALDGEVIPSRSVPEKLAIKDGARIVRVDMDAIQWIDAAGDYLCIHTAAETFVLRATLREMEQRLDPQRFQRIHRSTIVNVAGVRELRAHQNGEYFVVLEAGQTLKLSRSYKDKVQILA